MGRDIGNPHMFPERSCSNISHLLRPEQLLHVRLIYRILGQRACSRVDRISTVRLGEVQDLNEFVTRPRRRSKKKKKISCGGDRPRPRRMKVMMSSREDVSSSPAGRFLLSISHLHECLRSSPQNAASVDDASD